MCTCFCCVLVCICACGCVLCMCIWACSCGDQGVREELQEIFFGRLPLRHHSIGRLVGHLAFLGRLRERVQRHGLGPHLLREGHRPSRCLCGALRPRSHHAQPRCRAHRAGCAALVRQPGALHAMSGRIEFERGSDAWDAGAQESLDPHIAASARGCGSRRDAATPTVVENEAAYGANASAVLAKARIQRRISLSLLSLGRTPSSRAKLQLASAPGRGRKERALSCSYVCQGRIRHTADAAPAGGLRTERVRARRLRAAIRATRPPRRQGRAPVAAGCRALLEHALSCAAWPPDGRGNGGGGRGRRVRAA